jgi:hypothetical protein
LVGDFGRLACRADFTQPRIPRPRTRFVAEKIEILEFVLEICTSVTSKGGGPSLMSPLTPNPTAGPVFSCGKRSRQFSMSEKMIFQDLTLKIMAPARAQAALGASSGQC